MVPGTFGWKLVRNDKTVRARLFGGVGVAGGGLLSNVELDSGGVLLNMEVGLECCYARWRCIRVN